jgi:hypothetical protein
MFTRFSSLTFCCLNHNFRDSNTFPHMLPISLVSYATSIAPFSLIINILLCMGKPIGAHLFSIIILYHELFLLPLYDSNHLTHVYQCWMNIPFRMNVWKLMNTQNLIHIVLVGNDSRSSIFVFFLCLNC